MGQKILVVGATSKVGSALVDTLAARGEHVRAATRRPGELRPPAGAEAVAFDYDVHTSAKGALEDVDRVFMLSKWTELHPELALNRFVEHALAAGVRHLVFMTGMGVDKKPAIGLTLVEKRIAKSGMGYTFLRPNWLMQNFSKGYLLPTIRDISAIIVPAGLGKTSFVDARDVAEVAAAALTQPGHEGQTYELTGGESLTYEDTADVLSEATGRRINFQDATDTQFVQNLGDRWEAEQRDYLVGLFHYVREGQVAAVDPTTGNVLGRAPTTFAQFARDHAAAWR